MPQPPSRPRHDRSKSPCTTRVLANPRAFRVTYLRFSTGGRMRRAVTLVVLVAVVGTQLSAQSQPLLGFTSQSSQQERTWEEKFRALPNPDLLREYMQRLSARPHHVGSPYDKDNAEW